MADPSRYPGPTPDTGSDTSSNTGSNTSGVTGGDAVPRTGEANGIGDDAGRGFGREGTPRWVKVSAAVVGVLVLLLVVMLFAGSGEHGPGRHAPAGQTPGVEVPAGGGHAPPPGVHR
jgi:hypothetical protein